MAIIFVYIGFRFGPNTRSSAGAYDTAMRHERAPPERYASESRISGGGRRGRTKQTRKNAPDPFAHVGGTLGVTVGRPPGAGAAVGRVRAPPSEPFDQCRTRCRSRVLGARSTGTSARFFGFLFILFLSAPFGRHTVGARVAAMVCIISMSARGPWVGGGDTQTRTDRSRAKNKEQTPR